MQCEMQIKIETTVTRVSCLKRSSYVHIFYLIIQFFWDYHNILLHAHRNDTIWLNVQLLCFLSGIRFLINNVLIICLFNSKLTAVYSVLADIATWLIDCLILAGHLGYKHCWKFNHCSRHQIWYKLQWYRMTYLQ